MSRLDKIIEQTSYLLDKQHEAQKQTAAIFEDLLSFIEKSAENKPVAHKERLHEVYELLSKRVDTLNDQAQEDISFLEEQLKALGQVKQIKDPKIAAEMLESLIDEDEEILDTAMFKSELDEELEQSRQVLAAVTDDVKDAVERGDIKETEILIESMLDADDMDFDDDEDEDFDDEDEDFDDEEDEDEDDNNPRKKRGGCGDCSGGCGPKGCGGCSMNGDHDEDEDDFFPFLSKYDRDLKNDSNEEDACCDDSEKESEGCCKK